MARTLLIGLCIFAILNLHVADAKPALRNRRYIEDDGEDYNTEEVDFNDLRETRRIGSETTYPPYPGDDSWWYQDQETSEGPPPPPVPPPTEESYRNEPEVEEAPEAEKESEEEKFHEKVVPWFKRQWGHTKNFFKKHYETAKNSIG